jgi:hypothetical protein
MRYLLIFVGLTGLGFGGWMAVDGGARASQIGGLLFLLGTVWGAAGLATEDIVNAIRKKRT